MAKSSADAAGKSTVRLGWQRALLLALVTTGLFAAYLSVELRQNHEPGFPLDDSWIHLTFAHNLARGWGFAYNQGEPVAGSTAPLWTCCPRSRPRWLRKVASAKRWRGRSSVVVIVAVRLSVRSTLTPALSHPMGEGASTAVSWCS